MPINFKTKGKYKIKLQSKFSDEIQNCKDYSRIINQTAPALNE